MKILVDAVLFQLRNAQTIDTQHCTLVLAEMVKVAAARDISLTILDRGGLPDLGHVETCRFPSFKAAYSVADGEMLDRMGRAVGAEVFVSTALTMLPSIPNIQLLFGEGGEALPPGRTGSSELTECEIALSFSSAVVFASPASEDAFCSRFARRQLQGSRAIVIDANDSAWGRRMAEAAVDAAVESISAIKDADRHRRFLALRRMQAAFELSDDPSLAGQS